MRIAQWDKEAYQVLDCGDGEKLENWNGVLLIRPDPQIIWSSPRVHPAWNQAQGHYFRSKTGGGHWEFPGQVPEKWTVSRRGLTFQLQAMGFKHTGIFPEQAVNWDWMQETIRNAGKPLKILNLFGYTGAATLACLQAGASVTHVDASRGIVAQAKENARLSGLEDRPVRWLVDDCLKFVQREARRGNAYDGILMDPPAYGRGPGGEVWRLEEQLHGLIESCLPILSEEPVFYMINSYATGLSPAVMEYFLGLLLKPRFGGATESDEIGLPVGDAGLVLPCGSTAIWHRRRSAAGGG